MSVSTFVGNLSLTIVDCKDLDRDLFAKSDPYCYASLGDSFLGGVLDGQKFGKQHFKTKTHKNGGTTPLWDETHDFDLKGMKSNVKLKIAIYDQNLLKDQTLATLEIPLSDLLIYDGKGKTYLSLREKSTAPRVVGSLGVIVQFNCQQIPNDISQPPIVHQTLGDKAQDKYIQAKHAAVRAKNRLTGQHPQGDLSYQGAGLADQTGFDNKTGHSIGQHDVIGHHATLGHGQVGHDIGPEKSTTENIASSQIGQHDVLGKPGKFGHGLVGHDTGVPENYQKGIVTDQVPDKGLDKTHGQLHHDYQPYKP